MKKNLLLILLFLSCLHFAGYSQVTQISGKITDSAGEAMPGVNISVKGTARGTITDIDGNFKIAASPEEILEVSFIGFLKQEVKVGNKAVIDLILKEDIAQLEEVIVTGYTSEKRADITGAVAVAKLSDVKSIPAGNVMSTLQGRLPGVNVTTDGTPGGTGTSVTIRGRTSINDNNTPLYVVDGVQTRAEIATLLNAQDIESIQVLKDGASASIYGVQAANGVVIITTKKGKKGDLRVDFDTQHTAQFFHSNIKMLDAQQWGETYWKAYQNDGFFPAHDQYGSGNSPVIPEFIDHNNTIPAGNTNWAKEIYNTALLQTYNIAVSKGTETGSTSFSLNYFDHDGLIRNTNFQRFTARLNSDYNFLNNRLRVGENISVSKIGEKLKPGGIEELVIAQHPLIPVYDIHGGYGGPTQGLGDKPNPVRLTDQQNENRWNQWRIFGNMFMEVEPVRNLVFRSNLGLNYHTSFSSVFEPKWREGDRSVDRNILNVNNHNSFDYIFTNMATYNMQVGDHSINYLVGMEAKEEYEEWLSGRREDFLIQNMDYRYLDGGSGTQTNGNNSRLARMNSYFGKVNYMYHDKYLLSGTIRRDASSRFGNNNNSGIFPAVSAGWRISSEDFMKNVSPISDLKLRASWGRNGNDLLRRGDIKEDYAKFTQYGINMDRAGYDLAGNNQGVLAAGLMRHRTANPFVRWEVTTQTNFGVDLSMLDHRLNLTLDYFIKDTDDMLIDLPYIAVIGEGGGMTYNGASMRNNGIEAALNWRNRVSKDFSYDITFTATAVKNRITYVPEDIYYTFLGGNGIDQSIVGQPFGSWMGWKTNGLYRSEEDLDDGINQPGKGLGRIRYVDVNGDGVIDDRDRTWLGSDFPRFTGGLNFGATYKNFDFQVYFYGMARDVYNHTKFYTDFFQLWTGNRSTRILEAWTPDNADSDIPALTALNTNNEGRVSEYFIEDGSFIRLKNVAVGYTLPRQVSDKLRVRNLRTYIQGSDLLTFTRYTGPDPEGTNYQFPIPRTVTIGLNVGF